MSNIYLVGFMGAGKSTIGRSLARRLKRRFIDLDREIVRGEHRSITEIFEEFGEPHFRTLETEYLTRLSTTENAVIALGGGAFMDPANRAVAEQSGVTVWLKVSFATVVTRVKMDGTRPRFGNKADVERLFNDREDVYRLARIHVSAEESPNTVVDQIVGAMRTL